MLSLKKDRRDSYGANNKASRKLVPMNKAKANRKLRHGDRVLLQQDPDMADGALEEALKTRWRKVPDQSLGAHLEQQIRRAQQRSDHKPNRDD